MYHTFVHINWASGMQAPNSFPPFSTSSTHRSMLEINHMCVKCHLRIECYIRSSFAYILCIHPSLQVWILQNPPSLCRTERKGCGIGGNKKGACCAVETAKQRGVRLYGKSEGTTELDVLYRVLRRGRACYSNDNSRTELDTRGRWRSQGAGANRLRERREEGQERDHVGQALPRQIKQLLKNACTENVAGASMSMVREQRVCRFNVYLAFVHTSSVLYIEL